MELVKNKKIILPIAVILGFAYFYGVSILESNLGVYYLLKSQLALLPVQIGVVFYFAYFRLRRRHNPPKS